MFTDMVGYTALMQEDEALAKVKRDKHRAVQEELSQKYHGSIVQYFGDGTLIVFESAVDAVKCGIEIQTELRKDPEVPLRIGIHIGDVVMESDGIYGDGVNLASRIESMALSGSVFISGKVNDELSNHLDIKTRYLGPYDLKNVKKTVDVYCINDAGINCPESSDIPQSRADKIKSIAVLPFVNMSKDEENEYFSDGISEEILNVLSKIKGLRVTSRTSSFSFKNSKEDAKSIGKTLGVNTLLEGSVRKAGNRVRITAQLINTEDGYHYWSENFDRQLDDIFEVQDEISAKIAEKLEAEINPREGKEESHQKIKNFNAYREYLQGMYHFYKFTPENTHLSVKSFEKAIEIDPDFGPPHAGIANSLTFLGATGQVAPQKAFVRAEEHAKKGIELAPENYLSYVAMGVLNIFFKWNFQQAKTYLEKAIELNPSAAEPYSYMSWYYAIQENVQKQLEYQEKANELNPLSLPLNLSLAQAYMIAKEYDKAIKQYHRILELEPNARAAYEGMAWVEMSKNNFEGAIRLFEKYRSFLKDPLKGWTGMGYAFGASGQKEKALEVLEKLEKRQERDQEAILDVDKAIVYSGIGELDKAFDLLDKALEKRLGGLLFIRINPIWGFVKKHPRYIELIKKFDENILD